MEKVTIATISREMKEINGLSASANGEFIRLFIEIVKEHLKDGRKVFLAHLGTLQLVHPARRKVYVPRTGTYTTSSGKSRIRISTASDF